MSFLELPYQREGCEWLVTHKRVGLADEQGLGKTVQLIMAADAISAQRIVVVAPAKLRATWHRSFEEFGRTYAHRKLRVMSYEEATTVFAEVGTTKNVRMPDCIILDEAHYLKDWQSQRTQAIYPNCGSDYVWPASGTPMPNDPSELWTHFYYLNHRLIPMDMNGPMTPAQWMDKFCRLGKAYGGRRKVLGVKEPERLRELNRLLWKRRTLAQVMPQLPPMREGEITVEEAGYDSRINSILADMPRETYDRLLIDPTTLPVGDEQLSTLRKLLAAAKAPVLAEFVTEELTNNPTEKLVIFAWHKDAIDILKQQLKQFRPLVVDGRTNPNKVQAHVDAFQTQDEHRVFIGQIKAAGTGLTLTAASNVIFLECSWVPADNEQAQRRILRIGQKATSVLCRYVVLKGSIDEAVTRTLRRKASIINKVMEHQ